MEKTSLSKVIPDPNQPRKHFPEDKMKSLSDSIKKHGIVNPLIVEKQGDKFLIIDGERRWRAATSLGMKEVPIIVIGSKDPISRLVEQFHIQEQHEGWSPVEKAQVLLKLCETIKKPMPEVCAMLSIPLRTAQMYFNFAKIQDKDKFLQYGVNISAAEKINSVKKYAKKLSEEELEIPFTRSDEKKLEKVILESIKDEEIGTNRAYGQIKDAFKMNPKLIHKFMEGNTGVSDMFVKSKAKAAYHMRNVVNNANYAAQHATKFMEHPDMKLSDADKYTIKYAIKNLKALLNAAGEDGE